jgi:predicted nucleotide-binding protein (sugar kinase/HSP70/actin superfamily)
MKAAFTKEVDFFADRDIEYLCPAMTLHEPNLLKQQLFAIWGPRLDITEDESDFAVDQAWKAMAKFRAIMEEKGKAILAQVEDENRVAIMMLGRPYHNDPGLNHSIMDEFQVRGYPILSMKSIPKDKEWLHRFFAKELADGTIASALDINELWPENYSTNSAMKVWAARFAAHHPHIACIDLSSFKCGHDAPTYGIIDAVINTSGTPYSALHEIDANKPTGSIKIRVKTYEHSLKLYQEGLDDIAQAKEQLAYRIDGKRVQLLRMKQQQLQARTGRMDPRLAVDMADAVARMEAYEFKQKPKAQAPEAGFIPLTSLRMSR